VAQARPRVADGAPAALARLDPPEGREHGGALGLEGGSVAIRAQEEAVARRLEDDREAMPLAEVDELLQVVDVVLRDDAGELDRHARLARGARADQRTRERAAATHGVVLRLHAVEADLEAVELAHDVELARHQDAVRVHVQAQPASLAEGHHVRDVRQRQRLAAVEGEHAHAEGVELLERPEQLLSRELARPRGVPVAVVTGEVAQVSDLGDEHERSRRDAGARAQETGRGTELDQAAHRVTSFRSIVGRAARRHSRTQEKTLVAMRASVTTVGSHGDG
jgi:hypothetical protein